MPEKRIVKSACRMCHGVCQVLIHLDGDRVVKITGDPESPLSQGYICAKGAAAPELLYHKDRILFPLKRAGRRGENRWERISWDDALDEMAQRLLAIKEESGSEYVGMTQGTGRPYENIFNRFANAFGTPNFTAPAHVCYLPRILVSMFAMGFPLMPICDVYDHEGSRDPECVVIWGCNLIGPRGHDSSDGMCGGMLSKALKKARKIIVIDPRRISPAAIADHWLQLRPGTDGALALAMINVIISEDLIDHEFVNSYTSGFDRLVQHIKEFTPQWAEAITRVSATDIRSAACAYATIKPACIQWGNALDQSACNFQTSRSIMILRAITGNLDIPGGDFFPTWPLGIRHKTPFIDLEFSGIQYCPPEKMARKVDGGAYSLMPTVQQPAFWRSIASGEPYRMRAVWIMGSNPLVTATHSLEVEVALQKLEYVVVSDFFLTPTAQYADLFLPAATWLEYDEAHTSGGHTYSMIARRKAIQVGDTRSDQDVIIDLAHRLGLHEAFPWKDLRELNEWTMEGTGLSFDEFLERGIFIPEQQYYKYKTNPGFFATPSNRFEIFSETLEVMGISPLPIYREPPLSPVSRPDLLKDYPLILTSGAKMKDFFHSEGRQIPSLRKKNPDPLVEIHPETAAVLEIGEGDWVWIETPEGRVTMRVRLWDGMARDVVSAQHAWWFPEEELPEYGWKKSSVNLLFGDTAYDPDTGSESLRSSVCKIYKKGCLKWQYSLNLFQSVPRDNELLPERKVMHMNLKGKVALVTGASRGLGWAIALALGQAGADVVLTDILIEGQEQDLEKLGQYSVLAGHFAKQGAVKTQAGAQEIQFMGSRSRAFKMDVTDPDEVMQVVRAVEDDFGSIDILVNNAAVMDNMGRFGEQQLARWQRDFNVNLTGAYHCSKAVWPGMVKKNWGRIINISSVAGLMGAALQPSYGATKAGLIGLSKSLAIEAGRYGITVNTVCPGFIATEAVQLYDERMTERITKRTALKRMGQPEEVAQVVAFLASDAASYITGAVIPVTGGIDLLTI